MLETQIKELTKAINELRDVMRNCAHEINRDAETIVKISETVATNAGDVDMSDTLEAEQQEQVQQQRTHDDLKEIIMAATRANAKNKMIIKNILNDFGAMKLSEVKESDIEAVIAKVNESIL